MQVELSKPDSLEATGPAHVGQKIYRTKFGSFSSEKEMFPSSTEIELRLRLSDAGERWKRSIVLLDGRGVAGCKTKQTTDTRSECFA